MGISNWDIDVSKQNRNLYLVRPDLDVCSLRATASTILSQNIDSYSRLSPVVKSGLQTIVKALSQSYFDFRRTQCSEFRHKNFHTLRDFYWMIKLFSKSYSSRVAHGAGKFRLVAEAIETNFAGIYSSRLALEQKLRYARAVDCGRSPRNRASTFDSVHVFKRIFRNNIQETGLWNQFYETPFFEASSSVVGRIDSALGSGSGRYLLLFVDRTLTVRFLVSWLER